MKKPHPGNPVSMKVVPTSDELLQPGEDRLMPVPNANPDGLDGMGSFATPTMEEMEAIEGMGQDDLNLLTPEEKEALKEGESDLKNKIEAEERAANGGFDEDDTDVDHYRNLAKDMDANTLGTIAQDLIELVEADDNSRKDWFMRIQSGLRNLGVSSKTSGGANFAGASRVVHPVLMEACTQFQARAIQEMWPSQGPVQAQVLGSKTKERQDQAQRVMDYMNYMYTVKMTEAFDQEDKMLLRLPISGSTFKKMFYDPLKKRMASLFVEPADFIVSYQTDDLQTSPRFTHRIREYKNDVRKKEASGVYIKSNKGNTHSEDTDKPLVIDEIDLTEGKARTANYAEDEDEDRATLYEVYVDYNVEDRDDKDDPVLKPYIITVDRDLQTIKRIQRNWKPNDELKTKRMYFTHYKFTPGLGFYGYGFLHLIGDMAATATGALRSLLDAAAFSNLQGGFKTRMSRIPTNEKPLGPGEWREIDSSAEELKDAFFAIPYKEPSQTLYQLLGYVDEKARHLAGITETTTGQTNAKNSPVGTTAMLLEQGTKVFTAIHKRIHEAHKREFKIMADLIEEYMPDEGYPYLLGEHEGTLLPMDFDERIDVLPVSDPNISSNSQRVAKAQSILEMQQTYPNVIPERIAVRRMLEAIQAQDIDQIIGTDEEQTQKDQEAAAKAEEMEQLEKDRLAAEARKLNAEVDNIKSEAVNKNLAAIKDAFEAAAISVSSTQLIAISDALLKSAGFEDVNGGELAPQPGMTPGAPPLQGVQVPQDPMAAMPIPQDPMAAMPIPQDPGMLSPEFEQGVM